MVSKCAAALPLGASPTHWQLHTQIVRYSQYYL